MSGCVNCSGAASSKGNKGDAGVAGTSGLFGGFSGDWLFSTSTSTGPAVTQLRFDNATPASVANIYVSDTNASSIDYDAFLDSLSNNSQFGLIRIFKKTDVTKFWMGRITAVTDNGADHTIAVTYITSNSTFVASDPVVLTFSPAGTTSITVLNNDFTATGTANAAMTALGNYTIPANQLKSNGDVLEVTAMLDTNLVTQNKSVEMRLGGTTAHTKVTAFQMNGGEKAMTFKATITRQSATTVFVEYCVYSTSVLYYQSGGNMFYETGFSVSNLTSNTLLLEIRANNTSGGPTEIITIRQLLVKYLNKV